MGANLQESRDLAQVQALLNQMNQVTPFGNMTFSGPLDEKGRFRDPRQTTATTTLSPQLQAVFDQLMGNQAAFGQAAGGMLGQMNLGGPVTDANAPRFGQQSFGPASSPGINNPFNLLNVLPGGVNEDTFGQQRDQVTQATFDRSMALLDPVWQQQDRRWEQDMSNRGLPMSGEAYQTSRGNTQRTRGDTLNQLAMSSVLAGGQEQSRMLGDLLGTSQMGVGQAMANRGQRFGEALSGFGANMQGQQFGLSADMANRQMPLQELMSLFGASSNAQQPNFFGPGQTQVQNMSTPGQGSFMQQMAPGLINAGATLGGAWLLSDRRLKEDIKRVGQTDDGLPIYTFRYLGDDTARMGVMAQEALRTKPKAVTVTASGFLAVDYGQL
jgi:hypothetical protein